MENWDGRSPKWLVYKGTSPQKWMMTGGSSILWKPLNEEFDHIIPHLDGNIASYTNPDACGMWPQKKENAPLLGEPDAQD